MNNQWLHISALLKRLGIVLLLFVICRFIFFLFNFDLFPNLTGLDLIWVLLIGIKYDIYAVILINTIFISAHLIPNPWREKGFYQGILKCMFYGINGLFLLLEASDFIYYEFAQQRTSSHIMGLQNDILNLVPQFLMDFWYVILICVGVFFLVDWLYKKTEFRGKEIRFKYGTSFQTLMTIVFLSLFLIGLRGGITGNSIAPQNAVEYIDPGEVSLATNTTITVLHSIMNRELQEVNYFPEGECEEIFSPYNVKTPTTDMGPDRPNIMVIMLESFSKEYIGYHNEYQGYTPFLDSLMRHSLVFNHAFANGKHSIDALPSITMGLPPLMNEAYVTSKYGQNQIRGAGHYLNERGYHSAFFHGGNNGTLSSDLFLPMAGFDNYYGRNEFSDDTYFDGNWGIFDEPFFQFAAEQMDQMPQPFYSLFFSLSSHHPFTMPKKYIGKFKKGEMPIHEVVQYSDHALKEFFRTASKMDWYNNTIFIITADHTGPFFRKEYKNRVGHYSIPMVIHAPGIDLKGELNYTVQQVDILPTVLQLSGYEGPYFAFGSSLLEDQSFKFCVNQMDNIYQIIHDGYALHFDGEKTVGLYNFTTDKMLVKNLAGSGLAVEMKLERKIKAIIQSYHNGLIHDKLVIK